MQLNSKESNFFNTNIEKFIYQETHKHTVLKLLEPYFMKQ